MIQSALVYYEISYPEEISKVPKVPAKRRLTVDVAAYRDGLNVIMGRY